MLDNCPLESECLHLGFSRFQVGSNNPLRIRVFIRLLDNGTTLYGKQENITANTFDLRNGSTVVTIANADVTSVTPFVQLTDASAHSSFTFGLVAARDNLTITGVQADFSLTDQVRSTSGNILMTLSDSIDLTEDLVVGGNATVTALAGAITLLVGDDVSSVPAGLISASGAVVVRGDNGEDNNKSRSPRSNSAATACVTVCETMIEANSQNKLPEIMIAIGGICSVPAFAQPRNNNHAATWINAHSTPAPRSSSHTRLPPMPRQPSRNSWRSNHTALPGAVPINRPPSD